MENNTYHIFIELFLRNDLIKFIQTLQTFNKLDANYETILQHIFNNSSTHLHHIKLFLRIDLANYSNTSLNVDLHHNIYFSIHFIFHFNNTSSQQLSDRHFIHHTSHTFTTLSQQYFHNTFTKLSSQLMNHNL